MGASWKISQPTTFNVWLTGEMMRSGMTKGEIAEEMNVPATYITRWSAWNSLPSNKYIFTLADVLGVDREEMIQMVLNQMVEQASADTSPASPRVKAVPIESSSEPAPPLHQSAALDAMSE